MKRLALAVLLAIGPCLAASPIAIFGEKETFAAGSGGGNTGPVEPDRRRFIQGFEAFLSKNSPFEKTAEIVNPPSWGKTLSASTHGTLRYLASFPHGFVCHVTLENLEPDHAYILTLNGNPERAGNFLLPTPVTPGSRENYYDFQIVKTDGKGRYEETLAIYLKPGDYDVRWYVKDTSGFKIVLYRDFFTFKVE